MSEELIESSAVELEIRKFLFDRCQQTGSRYWNSVAPTLIPIHVNTDFDFVVCESDPVIRQALDLAEYALLPYHMYDKYDLDPSTCAVICFGTHTQLIVKLKPWFDAYLAVQGRMTPAFYRRHMWKSNGTSVEQVRNRFILLMQFFMNKEDIVEKELVDPDQVCDTIEH